MRFVYCIEERGNNKKGSLLVREEVRDNCALAEFITAGGQFLKMTTYSGLHVLVSNKIVGRGVFIL